MGQNTSISGSGGGGYNISGSGGGGYNISGSRGGYDEWIRQMREFYRKLDAAEPIIFRTIAGIEIVVMILTLCALCALLKSQRSTPVFVIHLILSDLIQIICILTWTVTGSGDADNAYYYSLIAGLYFMACVALERYLLVSHPIWYRSHHSLKVCCVISVIVWFVPLIFVNFNSKYYLFTPLSRAIAYLIPYPIIILCFIGTCRGLSRAISLTSVKRKKILGSLFLVLLTYTFLILPNIIMIIIYEFFNDYYHSFYDLLVIFWSLSECLLFLNPLADCVLYMFIRPDVGGLMKSVHCCCRTDTHQDSTHTRDEHSGVSSAAFACCVSVLKPASHSRTCTSISTS
ncbi:mas-related G-protein coupled receptor member A5-like [Pimephales promelas]|uniref:mas-related G-protein coupled receptor member A5-like n=1 Tax=Pimephales promelas TaxID=90988 RepID=UPI0019559C17|nr:mas-related G-protein coupled receptor member A5-like [Pimephales promelas]